MQYTTGTVSLTNGSATATFLNTTLTGYVEASDLFIAKGSGIGAITIASVDTDLQITLSSNWPGATVNDVAYRINTGDYTPNLSLPLLQPGDGAWMSWFNRAMSLLDSEFGGGTGSMSPVVGWDFWDSDEGWTDQDAPITTPAATYIQYASNAADPHYIISPTIGIDPDDVDQFMFRYKFSSGTAGSQAILKWKIGSYGASNTKTFTISYDGDWHSQIVDLSGHANWTGSDVTEVRLYMPYQGSASTWFIDNMYFGTKGRGIGHAHVVYEIPSETPNGSSVDQYLTDYEFIPNTVQVFLNGFQQRPTTDYAEDSDRKGITFNGFYPATNSKIYFNYTRPL